MSTLDSNLMDISLWHGLYKKPDIKDVAPVFRALHSDIFCENLYSGENNVHQVKITESVDLHQCLEKCRPNVLLVL